MALTKLNNNSLHAITDGSALKNVTGTVLQVQSNEIVTGNNGNHVHISTSATGEVDCGASLSFTPKSSSSKLFIVATIAGFNDGGNNWMNIGIHHDGSFLVRSGQQARSTQEESVTLTASVNSGSTNARTIKLRQYNADGGTKFFKTQSIVVTEVAG